MHGHAVVAANARSQAAAARGPKCFQIVGVGRENRNLIAAVSQVLAQAREEGFRTAQRGWIALHEMRYSHVSPHQSALPCTEGIRYNTTRLECVPCVEV